jgi:hypothetical protein
MTIASNGNVGIGTTAPVARLDIAGGGRFVNQNGIELAPYGTLAGNTSELRFEERAANGENYVGFKGPDAVTSNVIWTLPIADGTSGQVLSTSGTGALSWISGVSPTGAASGDLSGNFPGPTVATVGGKTSTQIATSVNDTVAATNGNTGSTLVKRDASGNFSAGTITATLTGNATNVTGTVAIANGGTGATSATAAFNAISPLTTLGDILYEGASSTATRLAGNTTAIKQFLSSAGTGTLANAPAWAALTAADIPGLDASIVTTGSLPLARGGTGAATAAAARTNLGLGSSATLNVGTAASNVVQLDGAAKLPAVDGSQLTGLVNTAGDTMMGTLNLPTNGLVAGTNQLVLSGGNIGIGTTAPSNKLSVNGTANFTGNVGIGTASPFANLDVVGAIVNSNAAGTVRGKLNASSGNFLSIEAFNGNNTVKYPVALAAYGGNVGIGTTAPNTRVDVVGGAIGINGGLTNASTRPAVAATRISGEIAGYSSSGFAYDDGFLRLSAGGGTAAVRKSFIDLVGYSASVTDMYQNIVLGTSGTERMRINSDGNVGIGTTAPANLLHIFTANTGPHVKLESSAADTILSLKNSSAGGREWWVGSGGTAAGAGANFYIYDATTGGGAAGVRLAINSSGNVGIGTTNPVYPLQVGNFGNGSSYLNGVRINGNDGNVNQIYQNVANKVLGITANGGDISLGQAGTQQVILKPSGNVGIGTTSPGYTLHVNGSVAGNGAYIALSDIRFKKDVQDLVGSLAKVLAIRGVSYKWIDEERNGSGTQYGVIAQEIEKILPDVVVTGSDGIKRVKYDDLIPLIIEALKAEKASKDAAISQLKIRADRADAEAAQLKAESSQLKAESSQLKAESSQLKAESAQLKASLCGKFPDLPVCSD